MTRRRLLLIIEGGVEPRFVYVHPDQCKIMGDIQYSDQMSVDLKGSDRWALNVPGRTYLWLCLNGTTLAKDWVDAVLGVLERAQG